MPIRSLDTLNADFELLMLMKPGKASSLASSLGDTTCDTSDDGSGHVCDTSSDDALAAPSRGEIASLCHTSSEGEDASAEAAPRIAVEHSTTVEGEVCDTSDEELLEEQPQPKRPRKRQVAQARYGCSFLGQKVCKKALLALIGVGKSRAQRVARRRVDLRRARPKGTWGRILSKPRKDGVFEQLLKFFWSLYCSVGEAMPDRLRFARASGGSVRCRPDGRTDASDDDSDGGLYVCGDSSDEERIVRGATLYLSQQRAFDDLLRLGPGTSDGPRRYLPKSSKKELYWQYAAMAKRNGERVASYTSFLRVFHLCFEEIGFLRFRKCKGDHAVCTACEGFKEELRSARNVKLRESILEVVAHNLQKAPRPSQRTRQHLRSSTLANTLTYLSTNLRARYDLTPMIYIPTYYQLRRSSH